MNSGPGAMRAHAEARLRGARGPSPSERAYRPRDTGWIHDIFDTKLNFEKSQYTLASLHERQSDKEWDSSETKCFDGASSISGKLLVVAPTGREVSHNGIEVMFRSILIDKVNVDGQFEDVMLKTWTLLEAGSIKEAIEIPFDIDLTQLPQLRDSFDGEHMALRHVIAYRIVRPWYTFSVRGEEAIGIFGALPPERMAAPENTRLIVNDFGGTAEFDHGKSTFTNDDRIVGNVFLSEMVG